MWSLLDSRAPGKRQIKPTAAVSDIVLPGDDEDDDDDFTIEGSVFFFLSISKSYQARPYRFFLEENVIGSSMQKTRKRSNRWRDLCQHFKEVCQKNGIFARKMLLLH